MDWTSQIGQGRLCLPRGHPTLTTPFRPRPVRVQTPSHLRGGTRNNNGKVAGVGTEKREVFRQLREEKRGLSRKTRF